MHAYIHTYEDVYSCIKIHAHQYSFRSQILIKRFICDFYQIIIHSDAGRIMIRRVFGKLAFFNLQDDTGSIQLYMDAGRITPESFKQLKDWTDGGDIIGARGTVKRSEKGELSVYVKEWQMLTKALLPLPDKWAGLKDADKRYRQRHLDMITNPDVRATFKSRAFITSKMRQILDSKVS